MYPKLRTSTCYSYLHYLFTVSFGVAAACFPTGFFGQERMNGVPGASLSTPRILWDGTGAIRQRLLWTSVRKSRPRVVSCIAWPSSSPCRPSSSHLCGHPTRCPVSLEAAWIVPFHEPAHFEVYLSLSEKEDEQTMRKGGRTESHYKTAIDALHVLTCSSAFSSFSAMIRCCSSVAESDAEDIVSSSTRFASADIWDPRCCGWSLETAAWDSEIQPSSSFGVGGRSARLVCIEFVNASKYPQLDASSSTSPAPQSPQSGMQLIETSGDTVPTKTGLASASASATL